MKNIFCFGGCLFLTIIFYNQLYSQDTLPKFKAEKKGKGKVLISWINPFGNNLKQISIQRSPDSLKGFKSIMTMPDPSLANNGYMDNKALNEDLFYRLYLLLDSGKYQFSSALRPIKNIELHNTANNQPEAKLFNEISNPTSNLPAKKDLITDSKKKKPEEIIKPISVTKDEMIPEVFWVIKKNDSILGKINEKLVKRYRDSITALTKDTVRIIKPDTLLVRPFIPKEIFKPSLYVFSDNEGTITISLPDAAVKNFSIKFFEESNEFIFEIKKITHKKLHLEKSNFVHSGWFRFELYENGKLIEKNKFYVSRIF